MMVIDASIVKRHIKPKADSTLLNMKKADLIEYIRTLEHNYNVAVSFNEQQARNIEAMIKNGDIPSTKPNLLEDWGEDHGDALWWKFPIEEPPYVGSPLDANWPGYHTHWTPIAVPKED